MRVIAKQYLDKQPDGDSPACVYCNKGDLLIVRAIDYTKVFPIAVSHPHITDRSFGVREDEVHIVR